MKLLSKTLEVSAFPLSKCTGPGHQHCRLIGCMCLCTTVAAHQQEPRPNSTSKDLGDMAKNLAKSLSEHQMCGQTCRNSLNVA